MSYCLAGGGAATAAFPKEGKVAPKCSSTARNSSAAGRLQPSAPLRGVVASWPLRSPCHPPRQGCEFFKFKGFGSLSSIPRGFALRRVSVATFLEEPPASARDDLHAMAKSPAPDARSCDMYSHMGTMPRLSAGKAAKSPGKAKSSQSVQEQLGLGKQSGMCRVPGRRPGRGDGQHRGDGSRAMSAATARRARDFGSHDSLESGSEYVKFSKEKYILDSSPEKLHKELEEELKLSSSDLRSHAWYHGRIPREVSESLVQRNGDFLIRDSLTSLGDYVLTCRWRNEPLHFKINKVTVKSSDSRTRIQYLFEQESFDNVPALVRFYVGNRRAVSEQSGAIVYCPINRTFPLRYLEASYGLSTGKHGGAHSPTTQKGGHIKRRSITMTDGLTADKITRAEGCPTSPCHGYARASPSPSVNSYSDPDTGHYCQLHPGSPGSRERPTQDAKQLPAKSYVERLKVEEGQRGTVESGPGEAEAGQRLKGELDLRAFVPPATETSSAFNPAAFRSLLIPLENKPLEMAVLKKVKELLAEVDAKTLAKHITKVDCQVARILGVTTEMQRLMGVSSGMELLTLPHGHQLRLDLLERFHTMSIMIAVDILGCTGSTEERAALLHKSIQLAAELKSTMGNMFSFAAVMNALEMAQVPGRSGQLETPHPSPSQSQVPSEGSRGHCRVPNRANGPGSGLGCPPFPKKRFITN
ncbi:PREDICTED: SH2 domain-containing protein 3C [Tinamus guttatus]|uniref:SH2 domain-containing protein 3C n=1 Tax=Tinamus guttatus TaxID=94827 RepID=UPI00052E9AB3|nr:PREDICTED: SH2 domain-containing protein 3C [Tinamus guttatus]